MSPVDPISPTSPMDISPITPIAMIMDRNLDVPVTPVISPSLHLPKLVTSFQNSATAETLKRMSMQFQLITPSPLSLRETPLTAVQRRCSAPWHKRSDGISTDHVSSQQTTPISPMSGLTSTNSRTPRDNGLPLVSPSLRRHVPSLQRQNANEGLESMQSPVIEQVVCLPLRLNARPSASALRTSSVTAAHAVEQLSTEFQSTIYRHILPKPNAVLTSNASHMTARVRPRSPIHKRRTHRRHLSTSLPTRIVVHRPQTPQQKHLQASVAHLASQLVPLISVRTGQAHPGFPKSLLQYHLLTHDQLDDLARWYHQTIDAGEERWMYPCPIAWDKVWCDSSSSSTSITENVSRRQLVDLDTKRRRWGRFIGLKGCDSPVEEQQESLTERMEREWRAALRKAEEEQRVREKLWGRRW